MSELLPENKWFSVALNALVSYAERRMELDFKDSYSYSRIISTLDADINLCLNILQDSESVPKDFYPIIKEAIDSSFCFGRWSGEMINRVKLISEKYA